MQFIDMYLNLQIKSAKRNVPVPSML